jgi:tetratricopeptide (TPR) repeat protein
MSGLLLDREAELATIASLGRTVACGHGRALLVEGPAGIGKTALMRARRQIAEGLGLTALTARGVELESAFGFGVVRQLFERAIDEADAIEQAFAGRARPAARLLGVELSRAPGVTVSGPDAEHASLGSLYWLTVNLARRAPLALMVDDAHWVDPGSLRFLSFLASRLDGLPVLLILAGRPVEESGGVTLGSLLSGAEVRVLRPGLLGGAAAAQLVRSTIPDATDELCRGCLAASGGNPFFLRELAEALREGPPTPRGVPDVVPRSVAAAIRARIARLPAAARELACAAAVLGDGSALRHAAAAAGLGDRTAAIAADALVASGILACVHPVQFMHPLIRSAVYEQLPPGERATAHEQAASLLAHDDSPLERIAAHLLESWPRGRAPVCEQLRAAAREGMRRGAPEAAVIYLRRALEEPPPTEARTELLLELGEAEALTLDAGPAAEHLGRGLDGVRDAERRLHAALLLAGVLGIDARVTTAVTVLERALDDSPDADPALLARTECELVTVARSDLVTRSVSITRAARVRSRALAEELDGGVELAAAAAEEAMAGDSAERTAELAERAIARMADGKAAIADFNVYTAVRCLLAADRFDTARRVLGSALERAREHGAVVSEAGALAFRCDLHHRTGDLRSAEADGRASLDAGREGWRTGLAATASVLAHVLVEQGELEAAASVIEDGGLTGAADSIGTAYALTMLLHARGGLRLAGDDPRAALEDLLCVGRRQAIMREPNPALINWRSPAALALAKLDRRDEALALAAEEVRLARRFGAPRALG